MAPLLAQDWTVYYFDLLGYGQSEKRDDQDVSLGIQNRVVTHPIAHWQVDTPDLLAHDFGGPTALRAHYFDGQRYRSLTLVDAVAVAPWDSPFVSRVRNHESAFAEMPRTPIMDRKCLPGRGHSG